MTQKKPVQVKNGVFGHEGPQGQQWLCPITGVWYQRKNDLVTSLRMKRDAGDPQAQKAMRLLRNVEKQSLEQHGTMAFCLRKSTI